MFLNELLTGKESHFSTIINKHCSQFINEASGKPLLKGLPLHYNDIQKVKVRQKKENNTFSETLNQAFKNEHTKIFQRAIFANGRKTFSLTEENTEAFYIFPVNGYKFMYSKEVTNSSFEYKQVFDALFEQFDNEKNQAITIIADLLKFNYVKENLQEGIDLGAEIILYNIPYYFAIRKKIVEQYDDLLTS